MNQRVVKKWAQDTILHKLHSEVTPVSMISCQTVIKVILEIQTVLGLENMDVQQQRDRQFREND